MKKKFLCLLSVLALSLAAPPCVYAAETDAEPAEANTAIAEANAAATETFTGTQRGNDQEKEKPFRKPATHKIFCCTPLWDWSAFRL